MLEELAAGERLRLPASGASAGRARRFVTSALRRMDLAHLEDDAALAVSELVTNAVLHTGTDVEVVVSSDPVRVRVEVGDASTDLPVTRSYGDYATTGRGLALVTGLVEDFGVQVHADGKTLWFTLLRAPVPGAGGADAGADELAPWDLDAWDLDAWADETGPEQTGPEQTGPGGVAAPGVALLLGLPVTLWLAAHEHHDAALRELLLYRGRRVPDTDEAWAWYAAARSAQTALSAAVDRAVAAALAGDAPVVELPPGHPSPAPRVPVGVVVEVRPDPALAAGLAALAEALDDADRLAAAGRLLLHPALPEVVALRDWCCHQVIAQAGGAPPGPWEDHAHDVDEAVGAHATGGPGHALPEAVRAHVLAAPGAVVAADERNRIVALSPAAEQLLGWSVDDLVGRRVVTLIPPRLRDAHVAGFTRHQVTGQAHVLGVEVVLPVLHADGHELTCRFLIDRVLLPGGGSTYLASLTAL